MQVLKKTQDYRIPASQVKPRCGTPANTSLDPLVLHNPACSSSARKPACSQRYKDRASILFKYLFCQNEYEIWKV